MYILNLRYKGFELQIELPTRSYYAVTKVKGRKTLYHLLFEHLIDGKVVNAKEFARRFKKVAPTISGSAVNYIMRKIEGAVKKSPNPKLRAIKFQRERRGGAHPAVTRLAAGARFTAEQNKIIGRVISGIVKNDRPCTWIYIRNKCLTELEKKGLATDMVLARTTIKSWLVKIAGKENAGKFYYRPRPKLRKPKIQKRPR